MLKYFKLLKDDKKMIFYEFAKFPGKKEKNNWKFVFLPTFTTFFPKIPCTPDEYERLFTPCISAAVNYNFYTSLDFIWKDFGFSKSIPVILLCLLDKPNCQIYMFKDLTGRKFLLTKYWYSAFTFSFLHEANVFKYLTDKNILLFDFVVKEIPYSCACPSTVRANPFYVMGYCKKHKKIHFITSLCFPEIKNLKIIRKINWPLAIYIKNVDCFPIQSIKKNNEVVTVEFKNYENKIEFILFSDSVSNYMMQFLKALFSDLPTRDELQKVLAKQEDRTFGTLQISFSKKNIQDLLKNLKRRKI
ncbi:MAG: hypothetical protein QXI58_00810 [Candidatus Micrarchaeia archaeon]